MHGQHSALFLMIFHGGGTLLFCLLLFVFVVASVESVAVIGRESGGYIIGGVGREWGV